MYGTLAPKYYDRGWRWLTPIKPRDKRPATSGWPEAGKVTPTRAAIVADGLLYPDAGIGLVYGPACPFIAMDIDILDTRLAATARIVCEKRLGVTPMVRQGLPPKLLLLYRKAEQFEIAGKFFGAFEVFSRAGTQTVIAGTHPATGLAYSWITGCTPLTVTPDDVPTVRPEQVYAAIDELGELIRESGYQSLTPSGTRATTPTNRRTPTQTGRGASDRTSGAMAAVLPKLRIADDPLAEATRLAKTAGYGSRYGTASGLTYALVAMGFDDAAIERAVINPYLHHFSGAESGPRSSAIYSALTWARSTIGADDHFRDAGAVIAETLAAEW